MEESQRMMCFWEPMWESTCLSCSARGVILVLTLWRRVVPMTHMMYLSVYTKFNVSTSIDGCERIIAQSDEISMPTSVLFGPALRERSRAVRHTYRRCREQEAIASKAAPKA